jgi:release factor glutamine methyltransferase
MDNLNYLINQIAAQLANTNADNCEQAAWWILENITGKNKVKLLVEKDFALTDSQEEKLSDWLQKLKDSYPLQYLLGSVPFLDLNIFVEAPILIPRPETEEWVENLIKQYAGLKDQKISVLDIGCGSGCIGLAIAKAFPNWIVIGVDISDKAIQLSEKNKKENKVENINFIKSDLFECVPHKKFDLIVSNPPYISQKQYEALDASVARWEDRQALVASIDGLSVIRKIVSGSKKFLSKKYSEYPCLALEVDFTHGQPVSDMLNDAGFVKVNIQKDYAGKDRVALAYFDN